MDRQAITMAKQYLAAARRQRQLGLKPCALRSLAAAGTWRRIAAATRNLHN